MQDENPSVSNPNFADRDFAAQRQVMVDRQIRTFDVTDQRLIARMLDIPRELFLPADLAPLAYSDGQLQVAVGADGKSRSLVTPFALARLIQAAALASDEKVLVVADGPGYASALIAGLAGSVVALESDPVFAERTGQACASLGIGNLRAFTGKLTSGYPSDSPYDVIFVLGVVEAEPMDLLAQLTDRGRLMTFQKPPHDPSGRAAKAVRITRSGKEYGARRLFDAAAPVLDAFRAAPVFVF
jgi:protein-L-isoaspartate(D-aspartate) O-methyltransferase